MSESALVRSVLAALQVRGVWSWRVNAGLTVIGTGKSRRVIKGAPSGSPDIQGVIGNGRLFGIECKTKTGTIRVSQKRWAAKALQHGVHYGVAKSVREALALVDNWRGTA